MDNVSSAPENPLKLKIECFRTVTFEGRYFYVSDLSEYSVSSTVIEQMFVLKNGRHKKTLARDYFSDLKQWLAGDSVRRFFWYLSDVSNLSRLWGRK